jgi:hypothetical protein
MEFHAACAEVVEHRNRVAQAAAQPVEFPHDRRVTGPERLQATREGRRFTLALDNPLSSKMLKHRARLGAASLQRGRLVVGAGARVAVFHALLKNRWLVEEAA